MTRTPTPSNVDPEVLEVLEDDPALVELACAILAEAPRFPTSLTETSSWRRPETRLGRRRLSSSLHRPRQRAVDSRPHSRIRSTRLSATFALFLLAVIVAPIAMAFKGQIVDLITGKPAPQTVVDSLSAWNRMLSQSVPLPNGGFGRGMQAVADQAAGVVSLQTPDGPVNLWAAPEVGGGKCFVVAINDTPDQNASNFRAIGSCDSQLPRYLYSNPNVMIPWPVSFGAITDASFVVVRVFRAPQVEVRFRDGSTLPLRIVDGFSLVAVPPNSIPPGGQKPITVVARDANGTIIATDPLLYSRSVG